MAEIIITGVAGFVGSNLAAKLLDENHVVTGIDNFSYGTRNNIRGLINNPNFRFYERNLAHADALEGLKGEMVVHLASQKIPRYSNALRTLDENAVMLKSVLAYCNSTNAKLVFASTSDIYGKNPNIPYSENSDIVLGPTTVKRWSYALSKIYSEQLIIANNSEYGLEYTIMRFFGSYGPNQNTTWWGGPQAVFIQNILENKPLEIHGDGLQTRTFTFIEDTVQGIMKCMFHPKSKNEIFNIANEPTEEITIKALAELIWKLMKHDEQNVPLVLIPYETFGNYEDVRRRVPNISKIKSMLEFKPAFNLTEGLKQTISWQTNVYSEITNLSAKA